MTRLAPRDLAYAGTFGAAGLLLPVLFHLAHLGGAFMPMYLPLVALAFFAAPLPAAITGAVVPLLSAAVTGMPPLYPPVALFMAVELAAVSGALAAAHRRWPRIPVLATLLPALAAGRALHVGMVFATAKVLALPARFLAGVSLLSGWPGIVLMAVAVPAIVRLAGVRRAPAVAAGVAR